MCGGKRFPATGSYLLPTADTGCRHDHAHLQPMRAGVLPHQEVGKEPCLKGAIGESAKCAKTLPKGSWPAQKTDSERGVIYGAIYELDDRARAYYSGNLRRLRGTGYSYG